MIKNLLKEKIKDISQKKILEDPRIVNLAKKVIHTNDESKAEKKINDMSQKKILEDSQIVNLAKKVIHTNNESKAEKKINDMSQKKFLEDSQRVNLAKKVIHINDESKAEKKLNNNDVPIVSCLIFIYGIVFNIIPYDGDKNINLFLYASIFLFFATIVLKIFSSWCKINYKSKNYRTMLEIFEILEVILISLGICVTYFSFAIKSTKINNFTPLYLSYGFIIFIVLIPLIVFCVSRTSILTVFLNIFCKKICGGCMIFTISILILLLIIWITFISLRALVRDGNNRDIIYISILNIFSIIIDLFHKCYIKDCSKIRALFYLSVSILQLFLASQVVYSNFSHWISALSK